MRNEYLDNQTENEEQFSATGLLGTLYGFSTLEMMSKMPETGRYYIPWTGRLNKGRGIGFSMVGKGIRENVPRNLIEEKVDEVFKKLHVPKHKFVANTWGGRKHMIMARGAGFGLGAMAFSDPIWFAMEYAAKPLMWPLGVAWFGLRSVAQGLEKSQYVSMSSPFTDTEATYTSRQRAVRAISESHLQARSAIGNEAELFHR